MNNLTNLKRNLRIIGPTRECKETKEKSRNESKFKRIKYEVFEDLPMSAYIKMQKLKWYNHIWHIDDKRSGVEGFLGNTAWEESERSS